MNPGAPHEAATSTLGRRERAVLDPVPAREVDLCGGSDDPPSHVLQVRQLVVPRVQPDVFAPAAVPGRDLPEFWRESVRKGQDLDAPTAIEEAIHICSKSSITGQQDCDGRLAPVDEAPHHLKLQRLVNALLLPAARPSFLKVHDQTRFAQSRPDGREAWRDRANGNCFLDRPGARSEVEQRRELQTKSQPLTWFETTSCAWIARVLCSSEEVRVIPKDVYGRGVHDDRR